MKFINSDFDNVVSLQPNTLTLICSSTGMGKLTAITNIVYEAVHAENKLNKVKKVLIIANTHTAKEYYNHLTCLIKGWSPSSILGPTEEERQVFERHENILSQYIHVFGDYLDGVFGNTTTLEGMENALLKIKDIERKYDLIILDNYGNISHSSGNRNLKQYECQNQLVTLLDQFRMIYPAAFIVMADIRYNECDKKLGIEPQEKLKGGKTIFEKANCVLEMRADHTRLKTDWHVVKNRLTGSGPVVYCGYDRGRFVSYSIEFQEKVTKMTLKAGKTPLEKWIETSSDITVDLCANKLTTDFRPEDWPQIKEEVLKYVSEMDEVTETYNKESQE